MFSFWFPLLCKSLSVWLGPIGLFLLLFLLPWETDLRKYSRCWCQRVFCLCFLLGELLFFVFLLFRAAPSAYGHSQARDRIRAIAAISNCSHSNGRSLTHWARPGIELASSWILAGFVSTTPQQELTPNPLSINYYGGFTWYHNQQLTNPPSHRLLQLCHICCSNLT